MTDTPTASERIIAKCKQYWNGGGVDDAEFRAIFEMIHRNAREVATSLATLRAENERLAQVCDPSGDLRQNRDLKEQRDGLTIRVVDQEADLAALRSRLEAAEKALATIATYDQDDRPLPGDGRITFDWRRRSMKQEDIARHALVVCKAALGCDSKEPPLPVDPPRPDRRIDVA